MKFTKVFYNKLIKDPIGILSTLTQQNIAELIQAQNHLYYTVGKPDLPDDIFDLVKEHLEKLNPKHPILKNVGSYIADDDKRKEKLPYFMGSLDKIKTNQTTLDNFKAKHPGEYLVSDKLDGNSALFHYNNNEVKLYTRGDGVHGQNITHLIPFIQGIPKIKVKANQQLTIRGELIINKENWETLKDKGANSRNMVAGLANSKIPDLEIANKTTFVAYTLIYPPCKPSDQVKKLEKYKFTTVHSKLYKQNELSFDNLSLHLQDRRNNSEYEIDGLVVMHDNTYNVQDKQNPTYAFAFKNMLMTNTAEVVVIDVEWNISKDGYLKPVVIFDSVKLSGVMISRATGFNGEFIKSNNIGPGARILITRSGDVIPYILKTLKPAPQPKMPTIEYKWLESGKEIIVVGKNEQIDVKQLESFFDKIKVKGIGPATVKAIFDAGYKDIPSIINMPENVDLPIKNKAVVIANLRTTLLGLDCLALMDASNAFGRGFGERKLKAIVEQLPDLLNNNDYIPTKQQLLSVNGVSDITATKFLEGLTEYRKFLKAINYECHNQEKHIIKKQKLDTISASKKIITTSSNENYDFTDHVIVFTGFRNKDWEKIIESNNGKVGTSISGKTTILVVAKDSESGKVKQAREKGITIITKDDFEKKYNL